NTSSHRQSGVVTISKHFEEWDKAGMKMMDCPLYEVAMKVESYTGSANGGGSAHVTRNLLTFEHPTSLSRAKNPSAGGLPIISVQGRTLSVVPVDGANLKVQVRDMRGASRGTFHAAGAATFS